VLLTIETDVLLSNSSPPRRGY